MLNHGQMHVYICGDQTYDVSDTLQSLSSTHGDPLVVAFLHRCCGLLKTELASLPVEQQARCPRFASIPDLVLPYRAGALNPALVQALTCIAQLGLILRRHSTGGHAFPRREDSCLVGICTGSLAAAAISCAHDAPSLLPAALHAVAVATRVGALAWDVADRLERPTTPSSTSSSCFPSWAVAVRGSGAPVLADYTTRTGVSAPYISGTSHSSVTISGPPLALLPIISERGTTTSPLPRVAAPYHAPHLYTDADIEHVVAGVPDHVPRRGHESAIPIITATELLSTSLSEDTSQDIISLRSALAQAARDCLVRRNALDALPSRIADHVKAASDVVFHHFACSGEERLLHAVRGMLGPEVCIRGSDAVSSLSASLPWSSPAGCADAAAKAPIAILSAAGRFPGGADSMDAFWDILHRGVDTHEMVPPSRWNAAAHVGDTATKNVSGTGFGCWLHQAGQFDVAFFNMSPREAAQVDPAQRMALLTAAEALEQAGIVPDRTPSTQKHRVGVWFGSTSNDWMETNSAQNIDNYFIPGGNRAFIPGRINYHFKFGGPSYTIDTACSSSLAALHLACNALWRGEVDTAIVGGTNVLTNPDMTAGLDRGHFLSRTGNCKTFDDNADGYCRGEAVVTMILKRLDDARFDSDPIQACILGVATNHNAEAESITRPCAAAQAELFEHLLAETSISPNDISYVEMHGTGTQAGDVGETSSVLTALRPITARGSRVRPTINPLHIGAAKSNVGHGEAAAGVTSLAKALLMLKHSTIPPHIGIKTKVNHKLPDLEAHNTRIAKVPTPWARPPNGARRVLLNNFSAAGGNTALILEDPPVDHTLTGTDIRRHHIVTVSAKTSDSLTSNLRNLISWLNGQPRREDSQYLPKLSYTSTARRMHHRHRVAVSASSTKQLVSSLQERLDGLTGEHKSTPIPAKAPSIVFAFTGQGSATNFGADMYVHFGSFRADVQRYDHLCTQMGFPSILPLFQQSEAWNRATGAALQLAHVCCQMAVSQLWTSFGMGASMVIGHSLGEYAALYAAGVLSQADVIYLVGTRAQLMERHLAADTHAMVVVMASETEVLAVLPGQIGQDLEVACRNGERNVVLGGTISQIKDAQRFLEAKSIRCHILCTPLAFHTSQVDPILDAFHTLSQGVSIQTPKIPVISPTKGKVLRHVSDFGSKYFVRHCRKAVNFMDAVKAAVADGLLHGKILAIEIGPSPVVAGMVKEIVGPSLQTFTAAHKSTDIWQLLTDALGHMYMAGANVNWTKYHADFPQCHEVLQLPAYGWTMHEYWMQYVNDWSLRKGDAPIALTSGPILETTSIHKVVKNNLADDRNGEVVLDIDINQEDVRAMVQGHKVYGVPLCTPSVYADLVIMIGTYAKQVYGFDVDATATEVADMNIQCALVANQVGKQQTLRIAAKFDAATQSAACTFSSVKFNGEVIEQHANCQLRFIDVGKVKAELTPSAAQAQLNMKSLHGRAGGEGNTFRFSKAMIYKMIGQLADFDPKYRGLCAIVLDNDSFEATGTISFGDLQEDSKWFANPAHLDALTQTGGFVMNANEGVDLETEVFINHGWASLKLFTKLDSKARYYSYVKMTEGKDKLWGGDIFVFDESEQLVALVGGVALQRVPKRLMEYVVDSANRKVNGGPKASPLTPGVREATPSSNVVSSPANPSAAQAARASVPQAESTQTMASEHWSTAIKIISTESGVAEKDLKDDVELADIGIDSLLSLVICGRFRDDLDVDITEQELYECSSIANVKRRVCEAVLGKPHNFDLQSGASTTSPSSGTSSELCSSDETDISSKSNTDEEAVDSDSGEENKPIRKREQWISIPPAWSMSLRGSQKRAAKTLFLFPDGCGSATSYLNLPEVSQSTAVVGFNSPFMKNPERMYEYTLQEVLQSYIAGLRRRQAHGPYHLGGWSAGGILAYAIAQELFAQGEDVASLTLIDSPPPNQGLDRLPDRFFDHCTSIGLFGNEMMRGSAVAKPPEWLMPHFRATIDLLHDYHAPPMSAAVVQNLQVNIIWAGDCAFDGIHYPHLPPAMMHGEDTEGMKFLTERRHDFGPGAWAELLSGAHVSTSTVDGEHHFSMMRDGGAQTLVRYVQEGLGRV